MYIASALLVYKYKFESNTHIESLLLDNIYMYTHIYRTP